MLFYEKRDLSRTFDANRIFYGEGRGEVGVCLHLPLKGHIAGSAPGEDYMLMLALSNELIEFLMYKRQPKGPELWDYDAEKASELFEVCGDNPSSAGVIIADRNFNSGPKLQVFLDKTFGANEIAVLWKNQLVGDEFLLGDFEQYLKELCAGGNAAGGTEG
jgi:hypothetical protein